MEVPDAAGDTISIPVNMSNPNPNGVEFDNLYLDMNGIVRDNEHYKLLLVDNAQVHPCTHPEGKVTIFKREREREINAHILSQPAPETEADMMVEIFKYTERVVNMIRPRKLLFMAIGRSDTRSMSQQLSLIRWCCATRENESTTFTSVPLRARGERERRGTKGSGGYVGRQANTPCPIQDIYQVIKAMGKTLSDDEKNKVSWDSNAITPGTPFMSLLATSLRYWVVQKMNTDPGWKNVRNKCLVATE